MAVVANVVSNKINNDIQIFVPVYDYKLYTVVNDIFVSYTREV